MVPDTQNLVHDLRQARRRNDLVNVLDTCDELSELMSDGWYEDTPSGRRHHFLDDDRITDMVREALRWSIDRMRYCFEYAVENTKVTHGLRWFDVWWNNSAEEDREGETGMVGLGPYDSRQVAVDNPNTGRFVYIVSDPHPPRPCVEYGGNYGHTHVPRWAVETDQAIRIANMARLLPNPQPMLQCQAYPRNGSVPCPKCTIEGLQTCSTHALRLYVDAFRVVAGKKWMALLHLNPGWPGARPEFMNLGHDLGCPEWIVREDGSVRCGETCPPLPEVK